MIEIKDILLAIALAISIPKTKEVKPSANAIEGEHIWSREDTTIYVSKSPWIYNPSRELDGVRKTLRLTIQTKVAMEEDGVDEVVRNC